MAESHYITAKIAPNNRYFTSAWANESLGSGAFKNCISLMIPNFRSCLE